MLAYCLQKTKNEYKFKETGDSWYAYQNKLDKSCFQHDMAYGDFKDLTRRPASDKMLCYKTLNIAKNPKYDGHQRILVSMVYKFFDKKTSGGAVKNMSNQDLAEEFTNQLLENLKNEKYNHLL